MSKEEMLGHVELASLGILTHIDGMGAIDKRNREIFAILLKA